jgi:hypothetical protein
VTKPSHSLSFLTMLALVLGLALSAAAQTTPQQTPPDAQAQSANPQPPAQRPADDQPAQTQQSPTTPAQPPDTAAPPATDSTTQSTGPQAFTGTVVKSGDKYMFQEEGTGKIYNVDHQDEVQKFEGKRVKVRGVLDPDGKTIHLQ